MENRTRWLVGVAIVLMLGSLAYVSWGNLGDNLVYYWTPGETLAKQEKVAGKASTVRLGGIVQAGSMKWDAEKLELRFRVADSPEPNAPSILVDSKGAPPAMFKEGIGVVVEGKLASDLVFHSDRVMVNHSNEYKPPEHGKAESGYGSKSVQK
ncbi:MAG: cytochrome c maturation protein CcmE [Deltaproteobacteria bacterium]|nr:cytochrome c maturation protein CcmE [Deltaproteobacteria bacterium]